MESSMKVPVLISGSICLLGLCACIPAIPDLRPKLYLYPVKGPIASQLPKAAITGFSTGITAGSISFQLPSGESCTGAWEPIPKDQAESSLASQWDLVFGEGYFTRNVLGSRWRGKARITGNKGSEFRLEFYRGDPKGSPLLGVAHDSAGNVYKVSQ
jgi:hypothetical protein